MTLRVVKTPFYWEIMENGKTYSLGKHRGRLALPLSSGDACTIKTVASASEEDESVTLLVLEDTPEIQEALRKGKIGEWAYPEQSVYYTAGDAGRIYVYNHLDSTIYAAVSEQPGSAGSTGQWPVKSNNWQYWIRSSDSSVHVSLSDCVSAQTAKVFQGRVGKVLHVQSLPSSSEWEGIQSVLPANATYSENDELSRKRHIGIKNNLSFSIYVCEEQTFGSAKGPKSF
ncbi:hypothetical protein EST38_g7037 [Candolleomyces aberdarensis]|uniref:Uncharacterized protein n=1 Tax=Candolleomyces aberdarensis TaxID=2316362 RepID=A0A4Q2DGB1_9AGAR|nr:hypothetical protein EST38_g7037 [Candolleomyces aberdarensis]